ncbi:hypothetical protein QRQ56_06095 [Bradyrhizobium sp. U531]
MFGLVPLARPKPLRRGEGPGIHVACAACTRIFVSDERLNRTLR